MEPDLNFDGTKIMRILFVEDNKTFAERLGRSLRSANMVDICASRDSALRQLEGEFYDLIILDLALPTADGQLDISPEHGQSVFYHALKVAPGTPVYILTGSEPDDFSLSLVRYGRQIDPWGSGAATAGIVYHVKEKADNLLDEVELAASEVSKTDLVDIDLRGREIPLSAECIRALRVFARLQGGVSCTVRPLGGGLSEARVLRVTVKDERGSPTAMCVAKLGPSAVIQGEAAAHEAYVKRLRINAATPLLRVLEDGLGRYAGVFYTLAEGYDETLFSVVHRNPEIGPAVIGRVRESLGRWNDAAVVEVVTVADIRRRLIDDDSLAALRDRFDLESICQVENMGVRASRACIHGDLHGGNVLVNGVGDPLLIDFGDVAPGFSCLDPVTLELSLIFHPEGRSFGAHALEEMVHLWPDVEGYVSGDPLGELVLACRDWAHDIGGGDNAVLAAGYAYGLRQLKYDTVDPAITLRLLKGITSKLAVVRN